MQQDEFDKLYGSKYLSHTDLDGDEPRLKISKVDVEALRDKNGTDKLKYILRFEGEDKGLAMNRTNAKKMAEAYGKQRSDWIGHVVQLYAEDTSFGKGVRVRPLRKPVPAGETDPDLKDSIPF